MDIIRNLSCHFMGFKSRVQVLFHNSILKVSTKPPPCDLIDDRGIKEEYYWRSLFEEQLLEKARLFLGTPWRDYCVIPPVSFHGGRNITQGPVLPVLLF